MRKFPAPVTTILASAALLTLAALAGGCGAGNEEAIAEPSVHHPLAGKLVAVQRHFRGLEGDDAESLRTFLRYADPTTPPFEVRRICGIAGKALIEAEDPVIAGFVTDAADHLYDDFFREFDLERLAEVSKHLETPKSGSEIERLRMQAVLRRKGALYEGTLTEALATVPFHETVAALPLDPDAVLEEGADSPADYVAAAEILGREALLPETADRERAMEIYREGLSRWPGDPLLVAGLAGFYLEAGDAAAEERNRFLKRAGSLDPENAAWPCLRAAFALRRGLDEEALEAIREMESRPVLSFLTLERARCVAERLEEMGYGEIRARIVAYRSASIAGWLEVRDLANRSIQRSFEYASMDREKDLSTVLEVPRILDRQIRKAPRLLFGELLRCTIVSTGFRRLAEQGRAGEPALAQGLYARADAEEVRSAAIGAAADEYAGQAAWSRYFDLLGEERFVKYLDHVLFGNEAEFLLKCADAENFQDTLKFTDEPYPFE